MESNIDNSSQASMSSHAKRRAQKKLKKQQGQNESSVNDQSNTPSEAGAKPK